MQVFTGSPDPDDDGLTPRRRLIMQAIDESYRRNGYPPSMREIADATGLGSTSSVSYQLSKLEEQGRLARAPGRPRTVKLRSRRNGSAGHQDSPGAGGSAEPAGEELARVRFAGRIAAGGPSMAAETEDEIIPLPRFLVGYGDLMMLRVAGDSMTGAAIADGDWVVVRRAPHAENGDIVAAMLDSNVTDGSEATVKTHRKQDGHVWLMPHNPAYLPIPGEAATIIGKVVAVLRRV
jgi:repressor LexA